MDKYKFHKLYMMILIKVLQILFKFHNQKHGRILLILS